MHIDEIFDAIDAGEYPPIGADWAQGRTIFGGLSAALLCRALRRDVDPGRRLRCLDIGFARPFVPLQPYRVESERLADGRNLTMCVARLLQGDKLCVHARAEFLAPLDADIEVDNFVLPDMASRAAALPITGAARPAFFGHFEAWLATPGAPFSGSPVDELGGYTRFAVPPRGLGDAHLVCLVDAWPPTITPRYAGVRPVSTVGWTLHLAASVESVAPDAALGYHARVHFGQAGVSSSSADIWAPDGRLLARSAQTSIVYG